MKKRNKTISSKEFDERFDKGEDMTGFLNVKKTQTNKHTQRINIDFPNAFLVKIDKEARKIGVARTALIKLWLSERIEHSRP